MEIGSKAKYLLFFFFLEKPKEKYLIYETNPENTHNYLEWSYDS